MSRCTECGESPDWRVVRLSDSSVAFACFAHLGRVCDLLQLPGEVSELLITNYHKMSEWYSLAAIIESAARDR